MKTPKIKTVCSAAKRFKETGKDGFKYKHINLRYILIKKATRRKHCLYPRAMIPKGSLGLIITCLPYT